MEQIGKIGYAYVVADIFHIGHLHHLLNCKAMCDKLVVGVLTNKATMEKKPEPIVPFEERIRIILSLKCVDIVVAQDIYSPERNVHAIKPDILFESASHDKPFVNPYGRTLILPYYPTQTSSKIKQRVLEEWRGNKIT